MTHRFASAEKKYAIISFSFESAKEADKLANAAADSLNSRSAQNTNKKTKIEALSSKRRRDVSVCGNSCDMERRVALKIVEAWEEKTGQPALVLNDGTKADILLGFGEGSFLPLQLKTTKASTKKTTSTYQFQHVCGYSGMPVVCWRCDSNKAWILDGKALDERAKPQICFSPSGGIGRWRSLRTSTWKGSSPFSKLRWMHRLPCGRRRPRTKRDATSRA